MEQTAAWMKGEKRSAARLKARSSRWRRSRERAPPAAGTYIWEIVHALGEGGESAEPGGGSARPSHGAGVADSPLTSLARDVAPVGIFISSPPLVLPSLHVLLSYFTTLCVTDVPEFVFAVVGCCHKA